MSNESLPLGMVRAKEGAKFLGIGVSTFRRWVRKKKLPAGRRYSPRCIAWEIKALQDFIDLPEHDC